jgi:hypothetical protein
MAVKEGTLGNDNLTGIKGEANDIYGDALAGSGGSFHGGNDTLTGGAKSPLNNIYGDAYSINGPGTGGDDTLIGGANSENHLFGDAYSISGGPGNGGNDTLIGGKGGVNYMYGDSHDAGPGPTHGGNDTLVSAPGTTDYMWGDFFSPSGSPASTFGNDTFVVGPNNGNDTIFDFQQGQDHIEIDSSLAGFLPTQATDHMSPNAVDNIPAGAGNFPTSFADLNVQEVNENSVIQFGTNDSVTVVGVTGLTADDFQFVA